MGQTCSNLKNEIKTSMFLDHRKETFSKRIFNLELRKVI